MTMTTMTMKMARMIGAPAFELADKHDANNVEEEEEEGIDLEGKRMFDQL
jgi:hypothetical protein